MNFTCQFKSLLFFVLLIVQADFLSAQLTFQRTFQAPGMNGGLALSLTSDGGYVVTGQHGSSGAGLCDIYVYKRDACGNTNFFNTYGDSLSQGGKSVKQTADGGFIVAGITQPYTGQETILMKLDAAGGFQWIKNFGNAISDWGMFVQQTTDGGYIITGSTVNPAPYTWDVFLIKTDAAGNTLWSKVFVAPGEDFAIQVEQTKDGGFFLSGYSQGSVNADADVLAIKTDINGNITWANVYGGAKNDGNDRFDGLSMYETHGQQTPDGGYAIVSGTRSFGVNDSTDIWLLKLSATGAVQWNKTYGGTNNEEPRGLDLTSDGGYAIVGWTMSYGFGEQDVFLVKTDSLGNLNWAKTFGGAAREKGESIRQSAIDHGYYIDGYSASFTSNYPVDIFDAYALKTDSVGFTGCNETYPVPTVGSGAPVVKPFVSTLSTVPTRPSPVYVEMAFNPGEYALCETLPPPDVAQFSAPNVCPGDSTVFTDASTAGYGVITEWIWDFGDGSPFDSIQNPVHTYSASGTYSVTLVIHTTYSCIPDSITLPVIVNPLPVADLDGDNVCFNNITTFTDLTTGNNTVSQWDWDFGDMTAHSTAQSPTHTYTAPGSYTVDLIVKNNFGCVDTNNTVVVVNPLPVASFVSTTVCAGDTSCFNDMSSISSGSITVWGWNFDDPNSGTSNISNTNNPCHAFTGLGPYNVILTVTSDSGCQTTTTLPAIIMPLPVAIITPQNACLNSMTNYTDASTTTLTDPLTGWDWAMTGGNPASATTQNASTLYPAAGTYSATLIVTTQFGCKDTTVEPVIVYIPPVADFSGDGSGCAPLCISNYLDSSSSIDGTINSWVWSFPGGVPSSAVGQVPPTICYNNAGTYGASLTVASTYGCTDSVTISPQVIAYPLPDADFCLDPDNQASVADPVFNFCDMWTPNPGVTNWIWDFGDGSPLDSTSTDPIHSYSLSATNNDFYSFTVTLLIKNQYGCWDSISKVVELLPEFVFYIPNTFTPNGDGDNDFFFGKCRGVKEYTIWVFDRWGNQLWDCHYSGHNTDWDDQGKDGLSSYCKWDGKVVGGGLDMNSHSNERAQEDVYVWKVELTDIFEKRHNYIGHVNIVR